MKNFINPLISDSDHVIDNLKGDFQTTTEKDHHVLKVYNGTSWVTLFDEDTIKGWIASLALFRGTISEDKTVYIGTVQLNELPDLTALSAAADGTHTGRYWIWQGASPYSVVAGSPEIGPDLTGIDLQVGDWLSIADRGNGIAGDPNEVDLHWVRVGGDLLTASRGRSLFGLNDWLAGAYETGSMINYAGNLYRAMGAITPTDPAPNAVATIATPPVGVPLPISVGAPTINSDPDIILNLVSNAPPNPWTAYQVKTAFRVAGTGTGWDTMSLAVDSAFIWTGSPKLNYVDIPHGITVINGWMHLATTPATFTPDAAFFAAMKALEIISNWKKINIGGGIKFVPQDSDLPAVGTLGDSYLVVTSTIHGGLPAIMTWDMMKKKWVDVSGAAGNKITITHVHSSMPALPAQGDMFIRRGLDKYKVEVFDGGSWWTVSNSYTHDIALPATAVEGDFNYGVPGETHKQLSLYMDGAWHTIPTGAPTVTIGGAGPTAGAVEGDLHYGNASTSRNNLQVYHGGAWVDVAPSVQVGEQYADITGTEPSVGYQTGTTANPHPVIWLRDSGDTPSWHGIERLWSTPWGVVARANIGETTLAGTVKYVGALSAPLVLGRLYKVTAVLNIAIRIANASNRVEAHLRQDGATVDYSQGGISWDTAAHLSSNGWMGTITMTGFVTVGVSGSKTMDISIMDVISDAKIRNGHIYVEDVGPS